MLSPLSKKKKSNMSNNLYAVGKCAKPTQLSHWKSASGLERVLFRVLMKRTPGKYR